MTDTQWQIKAITAEEYAHAHTATADARTAAGVDKATNAHTATNTDTTTDTHAAATDAHTAANAHAPNAHTATDAHAPATPNAHTAGKAAAGVRAYATPSPDTEGGTHSLLQSVTWGALKSTVGWRSCYFMAVHPVYGAFRLLVLVRLLWFRFCLAYIAGAPSDVYSVASTKAQRADLSDRYSAAISDVQPVADTEARIALLSSLSHALVAHITPKPFLIRWDPPFRGNPRAPHAKWRTMIRKESMHMAPHDVQPRHTILIDLHAPTEKLLARMKSKTRYNIRLAQKRGIEIQEAPASDLRRWYTLYGETCARNRIGQRTMHYFETLFRIGCRRGSDTHVQLFLAQYAQTLVGGIIVVVHGGVATYLFGASKSTMRNLMANYLLQWHAMLYAKECGCQYYDLYGVAPQESNNHLSGLYRFKSGFGGMFIERWGSIDYLVSPFSAHLYHLAEHAYFSYHRRFKKR